ncbi:RecQ family ATP-dependent DNA helicase [Nocardioides marmoraquaticus]
MSTDDVARVAHEDFGHDRLLAGQEETVAALVDGRDVLLVSPTGSGKSLTYLVAGRLLGGPVVVVSPLLALQQDQVDAVAAAPGEVAAARLSSRESPAQRREALRAAKDGSVNYLLCSPELLADPDVRREVGEVGAVLAVVDEAHCVSTWGSDFRPDYQRLGPVLREVTDGPVLAMTATAAAPVRDEVVERLGLREPHVVVTGFARPELVLDVRRCRDEDDQHATAVALVAEEVDRGHAGLVYARTRPGVERLAGRIADEVPGAAVAAYHAGLGRRRRDEVQERFMAGELDVVVATSAFGLGIDKPDVRFVVHAQAPESLDTYWQEAGRGGRDGDTARATLLFHDGDLTLGRFFTAGVPSKADLRRVVGALHERPEDADPAALAEELPFGRRKTARLLNLLALGQVHAGADEARPVAPVEAAVAVADARRELDRSRVEMVRHYAETPRCRTVSLLGYFGEQAEQCGRCDTCRSGTALEMDEGAGGEEAPYAVDARVSHDEFGAGVVTERSGREVVVLFDDVGYRTLDAALVRDKQLLRCA